MTRLEVLVHLRLQISLANENWCLIAARTILTITDAKPTVEVVETLQLKLYEQCCPLWQFAMLSPGFGSWTLHNPT